MIGIAVDISMSKHRRSINMIYEEINNIERYRRVIKNEGIYSFLQLDDIDVVEECLQNSEFLSEFKEVIYSSPDCKILSESINKIKDFIKSDELFWETLMNNSCVIEDEEYNHKLFRHIDDRLLSNKVFALNLIKKISYSCNLVSSALMHDRQFALEAVRHDGSNLYYASEGLKNDREVVLAAVMSGKNAEAALWAANDIFKNDREIVAAAISMDGLALEHASQDLKNDREIVLRAVSNRGIALEYANKELKNDMEILLSAVDNEEDALAYVPDKYKNNPLINLVATGTYNSEYKV
jgi:hypothetical protein